MLRLFGIERIEGHGAFAVARAVERWFERRQEGGRAAPESAVPLPHFDVVESPQAYVVTAEVPGVEPGDLEVSATATELTVKGDKLRPVNQHGEQVCISERSYGEFERTIRFERAIDPDAIEAETSHGVLRVRAPKTAASRTHKVEVRNDA